MVDDQVNQTFRVHRSAMTSPEVHRAEIERIFAKSWLYVGHESEIPNPGDFVRRPLGGRPIFMVRGVNSGNVNVFHNSCTHRGALVCRQDSGTAKVFSCFYHAWSFDTEGELKGVPDRDAYAGGLKFDELGLKRVGACRVLPRLRLRQLRSGHRRPADLPRRRQGLHRPSCRRVRRRCRAGKGHQ